MLLEEIGYVVETVGISGRTTAVVQALPNCYAPTIVQTYGIPQQKKGMHLPHGSHPHIGHINIKF